MQVRTRMLGPVAYPVDQAVVDKNTSLLSNRDRQGTAFDDAGYGRRCCASSTASTLATRIEILEFQCSIALNDLCTSIQKRRPIPGGVFTWAEI